MTDETGLLIILGGPPGAGKTTIASGLARGYDTAVHLHTDDFWSSIVSGGIAPFEAAARTQNHVVLGVVAGASYVYAAGGFVTVVDGVVGPWMLHHFLDHSGEHPDVTLHYVVLRPSREVTLRRAQQRSAATALTDEVPVLNLWDQFADLGELETHAVDTTSQTPESTLRTVREGVEGGRFVLRPPA